MSNQPPPARGQPAVDIVRCFRATLVIIGVLYVLMAASMLVRGVGVMRDFGVSPALVASPVLEDFFLFFYQLMALVGVLIVVFGLVVRGRRSQGAVAAVLCVSNVLLALRDLQTSDCALGSRLYRGSATLMFVAISAALALVFGYLAWRGLGYGGQSGPPAIGSLEH